MCATVTVREMSIQRGIPIIKVEKGKEKYFPSLDISSSPVIHNEAFNPWYSVN